MKGLFFVRRSPGLGLAALLALAIASGCASTPRAPSAADLEADKYLFDRGTEALVKKRWLEAREYYRKLVDTYPQSPYRQEAKLGLGDTYIGENREDAFILAANEFREFLRFFPLNPRADYAQYRLAMAEYLQMLSPERDQKATRDALAELDAFIRNYPESPYLPEVLLLRRQARDRLSDSEALVGIQYFRFRAYAGSIARLEGVLRDDPQYTRRDRAYYYLGEAHYQGGKRDEALPYFEKLVQEFAVSEFLERAKARIAELKR